MSDQDSGRISRVPEELRDDDPGGLLAPHLNISKESAGAGMGICENNLPTHSWRRGQVFNQFQKCKCLFFSHSRASNTFCQMACGMLSSIGDFLKMGSDEIIKNMYDISDDIDEEDSSSR